MKAKSTILFLLAILMCVVGIKAQNANRLVLPNLTALPGGTVALPLNMDNASEIVAVEFDLQLPEGSTLDADSKKLTNRATDHQVRFKAKENNTYHCLIYSPTNSALLGRTGQLMTVNMHVSEAYEEGSEHPFELTDVVLALRDGNNGLTEVKVGTLTMQKGPDLYVNNVATDAATYAPGSTALVNWQVSNIGAVATEAGWTEYISIKNTDGTTKLLSTTYYDETLAANAVVSRQVEVALPTVLGMDGDVQLEVEIQPYSGAGESQGLRWNNKSATEAQLSKLLTLDLPTVALSEANSSSISCTLTRSGNRMAAESFTLTATEDSRVTLPAEVTIAAGQSAATFYIRIADNTTLDDNDTVDITASGGDYSEVSGQLVIEDNEYPILTITTSKDNVNEGETFQLTITASRAPTEDLKIMLSSETSGRFSFPNIVILPAGETSVTADIKAIDDNLPSQTLSNVFTAYAPSYIKSEVIVILYDDDVPALELTLTPNQVSEGDGPVAVAATLRRTGVTTNKITVKLSDDSEGGIYYATKTIELAEGVEEAHFNIGPNNNAIVDGDRVVNITAAVYISSCSCSASGESAGVVSAQLTILDDDGPVLNLTSATSTLKEGETTELTITRNTSDNSTPLVVTLNSDHDSRLTYDKTVTIPAGQASTTVEVISIKNSTLGDSFAAVFTISADGFSSGTCYIMVTDQTLPDITVKAIEISPAQIIAGEDYSVDVTFANIGMADVPALSTYSLSVAGQTLNMTLENAIQPSSETKATLRLTAPTVPGSYDISVECNNSHAFRELQDYNNSMIAKLAVSPAYTYTLSTDQTNYQMGGTVRISGVVTPVKGSAAGVVVEPYIICYGSRTALSATTDSKGAYSTEYTIPNGMGGDFIVGVCTPGENLTEAFATIHAYGMARTSASYIKNYLTVGVPFNVNVPIKNMSSLPLHNIHATVTDNAGHYEVTTSDIPLLEANAETTLQLTLLSQEVSTSQSWERVWVSLDSDEGAELNFVLYNFTNTQQAQLVVDRSVITTNISKSKPTTIPVVLTNTGLGETGRVTVTVPTNQTFFSLTTPTEIPSLATGDSTVVGLRFNPEGLDVNVIQRGSIAINCENGDGQVISYNLKVVGEEEGSLLVRVQDENTIYGNAEGQHPYVAGATVTLRDYNTGATLYSSMTSDEGSAQFNNLPEGYYTLYVTASKHDSYMQNVLVSPAQTTEHLATISYQAISISWKVEETTTDDHYEIISEVVYETQVPVPVIELITPDTLDLYGVEQGEPLLYYISVTNKGLITANNVCVELPQNEGFLFTPLDQYAGFDLAPQQGKVIPVLVTLDTSVSNAKTSSKAPSKPRCHNETYANWQWVCKSDRTGWIGKIGYFLMRKCDPGEPTPKEPKPETEKTRRPTPPPGEGEPELRYFTHPVSQVDLQAIYEIVSTLSCGLACFFPHSIPEIWKPNLKDIGECILDEAMNRHDHPQSTKKFANSTSLREKYFDRLELYINLNDNVCKYYAELANVSQLLKDEQTFNLLIPVMDDIIELMAQMHSEGVLYTTNINDIYDMALPLLPQQSAVWYDFSLREFIERQINTFRASDNMDVDGTNYCNRDNLQEYLHNIDINNQAIVDMGYANRLDMIRSMNEDAVVLNEGSANVCSTVKLQFTQEMVLTRQAFRGTLVIENSAANELTAILPDITATDENGTLATSHEMQINLESTEGVSIASDGTYSLAGGQKGTFTYLFIPTKYAAPEHEMQYKFGGSITFNDGDGVRMRSLYPVALMVKPTPEMDLTYFMQRDIYGDDPLTEAVEPIVPAEFALLINNKGYGDATDVRITTRQPEIVENEKGLNVEFKIVRSQVNGEDANLALGQDIVNDFGTIPAHSTAYAQWWLTSTLLGHFTSYNVEATHLTSYGNEDLSLLDKVTIHELIHSIEVSSDEGAKLRGFLVNDFPDSRNLPDVLYLTTGDTQPVAEATSLQVQRVSDTEFLVTVQPAEAGWNYGNVADPTYGMGTIQKVVRQSDNKEIPLQNVWQTDRTLRDQKDPLYENRIHLADSFDGTSPVTYFITVDSMPEVMLEVVSIEGIPTEKEVAEEPIEIITVNFSKAIDRQTFNAEDIKMSVQAVEQDASLIAISTEDNKTFTLDLSAINANSPNGYYTLSVQTAGITDAEGFNGKNGKQVGWVMYRGGLVQLLTSVYPLASGSVQKTTDSEVKAYRAPSEVNDDNTARYGSTVTLTATAADGYEFVNWTLNDASQQEISKEAVFVTQATSDLDIVANFRPKSYEVKITTDVKGGAITGAGTGIYEFGSKLQLTAQPEARYELDKWLVNGQEVEASGNKLTWTVAKTTTIEPVFRRVYVNGDVNDDDEISPADAIMILYNFFEVEQDGFNESVADINKDGKITPADAIEVLYMYFEIVSEHASQQNVGVAPRRPRIVREPQ